MNEMLKLLYADDTGLAKWCPKIPRGEYIKTKREDILIDKFDATLDENQKLLLKKLLDMHRNSYFDYGKEAFIAGARTAARLIIEMITDD